MSKQATKPHQRKMVSSEKAGPELGVSGRTLRDLAKAGKAPCYTIGNALRFDVEELRQHFKQEAAG